MKNKYYCIICQDYVEQVHGACIEGHRFIGEDEVYQGYAKICDNCGTPVLSTELMLNDMVKKHAEETHEKYKFIARW